MDCSVYFIEWEFCRIIPLSADGGISVGALYAGALQIGLQRWDSAIYHTRNLGD